MTDDGLRLVQTFLARRGFGIFLVSYDVLWEQLVCDCPGFGFRGSCKHVRFVMSRAREQDGAYTLNVPAGVTAEDMRDPEAYRQVVLRYSKPIVL